MPNLASPVRNKFKLSNAKVENVVNAPNPPMKIRLRILGEIGTYSNNCHRKPIRNEPKRLTTKVPQGKSVPNKVKAQPEIT